MAGHLHDDGLGTLVVQRLAQRVVEEGEIASMSWSSRPRPQQYQSRVGRPSVFHRRSARPNPRGWSAVSGTALIPITRLPNVWPLDAMVGTS